MGLFLEKAWERKTEQGLGAHPQLTVPPLPSLPPTGDSPLQPFIASAMGVGDRQGGGTI